MRVCFLTLLLLFLCVSNGMSAKSSVHVESVQADFVQEKNLPILARPLLSKGKFLFRVPKSLRWEYFSPLSSVLLMENGQIRKFVEYDGEFVEERGMGLNAMQVVLQEIMTWLDGEITDTPTFFAKQTDKNTIILSPRKAALTKIITKIELKLADQPGLMESVTIYEGKDSFTRMIFSNGVLNGKIPAARFSTL